ncbi:hypothetical protein AAVH_43580 [Aphelenchoides avenae]|nr:hypothetical protein AAVH_43580 [Aphelenchus avenae]
MEQAVTPAVEKRGPGPVVPSHGKEGTTSEGAVPDGPAIGKGAVQAESQRLKRQAPRVDDINVEVKAVDNSHNGTGGHSGAERLTRQAPTTRLDDINIKINAVDNSRHGAGAGRGGGAGGGQGEPEAGRLTRRG